MKIQTKFDFAKWNKFLRIVQNKKSFLHDHVCKKDLSHPIEQTAVADVENGWYEWWEKNSFFTKKELKSKFVMLLPPPNITGELHMGHAVTCAVQDAIIKWNQMKGRNVLWIPGCDHAGIATQVVVERHLWETKKVKRHELGRERFTEEVLQWKFEKEKKIYSQMRRMGVSLNWKAAFFTLDQNISEAVKEAFIQLFEENLIYRGKYMINWCCALQSVISDIEVEMMDIDGPTQCTVPGHENPVTFGYIFNVKYRLADSDETVTVSTTRPETVLGDTALMVHPGDPRYISLHGRKVIHPFRGDLIPIVTDTQVSKEIGTGVVKVTPGHSVQDYEVAKRNNLPIIEIFDDRGNIAGFQQFEGLPRFAAREHILNLLASKGLLGNKTPHSMQLPKCMRTGDVVERRLKSQWFLSIEEMAESALKAAEDAKLNFHPPEFVNIWRHFLSDKRDWCVSRQLWWGHKIPVYWASVCKDTDYGSEDELKEKMSIFVAASNKEAAKQKAASKLGVDVKSIKNVKQEEDVLDTWFSSSLLPFVVFGWPKKTRELEELFPLSLMETGHDILYFWVARMVMMSLKLTGQLPFNDVLLHGMVCDSKGQKMSKSKGNILDPVHVMEGISTEKLKLPSCGADGLRFALCSLDIKRRHIAIDLRLVEQAHFFRNKIWQTFRFLLQNIENIPNAHTCMMHIGDRKAKNVMDRWLLSQLAKMVSNAHEGFTSYNLYVAAGAVKKFWISYLCDVYLEGCKPRLWGHATSLDSATECLLVLWTSIHTCLHVLAPFMPFLTEELYGRLPSTQTKKESMLQCDFPEPEQYKSYRDQELEEQIDSVMESISALRNLRKSYNISSKSQHGKGTICIKCKGLRNTSEKMITEIQRLSFLHEVEIRSLDLDVQETRPGVVVHPVSSEIVVMLHLQGMIDPVVELNRLSKKASKLQKERVSVTERILRCHATNRQPKVTDTKKIITLDEEMNKVTMLIRNLEKIL